MCQRRCKRPSKTILVEELSPKPPKKPKGTKPITKLKFRNLEAKKSRSRSLRMERSSALGRKRKRMRMNEIRIFFRGAKDANASWINRSVRNESDISSFLYCFARLDELAFRGCRCACTRGIDRI